jgi:hypothetical protein
MLHRRGTEADRCSNFNTTPRICKTACNRYDAFGSTPAVGNFDFKNQSAIKYPARVGIRPDAACQSFIPSDFKE